MVLGYSRKTRTRKLMEDCKWLYFRELVLYHSLIQLFKIVLFNKPKELSLKLTVNVDRTILVTRPRLKCVKRSFRWWSVEKWNDLPDSIRQVDKLSTFKKSLRKHIIDGRAAIIPRKPPELD